MRVDFSLVDHSIHNGAKHIGKQRFPDNSSHCAQNAPKHAALGIGEKAQCANHRVVYTEGFQQ